VIARLAAALDDNTLRRSLRAHDTALAVLRWPWRSRTRIALIAEAERRWPAARRAVDAAFDAWARDQPGPGPDYVAELLAAIPR